MPSPRLLVIEGNSPQTLADHVAAGGTAASKGYSDLLRELLPGQLWISAIRATHGAVAGRFLDRRL
jgi:GMP synthase (glutamine-hydrolysing)